MDGWRGREDIWGILREDWEVGRDTWRFTGDIPM